jgi:hypothetical protein
MWDTEELIRNKTDYRKLKSGKWQAVFPGREWRVSVTSSTLEEARHDLLDALDARLWSMLCEDLGLREEPQSRSLLIAFPSRRWHRRLHARTSAHGLPRH